MPERLLKGVSHTLLYGSALALALMMSILTWQVFARYVLGSSPA